jgi:hypothetical protein
MLISSTIPSKLGWKALRRHLCISAYCSFVARTESVKFWIISWVASGFVPTEDKFRSSTCELGDAASACNNKWAPANWLCCVGLLHQILQTPSHQYHSLEKLLLLLNGAFWYFQYP